MSIQYGSNLAYTLEQLVASLCFQSLTPTTNEPHIFLPTFQRDTVWKSKQICELWDSLMCGIPIPSLILSRVSKSAEIIKAKSSSDDMEPGENDFWLLDGQQRAVALICGFGHLPEQKLWLDLAWFSQKEHQKHARRFGFFLCTKAFPWGSDAALETRPGSAGVRSAREKIDKKQSLNGCFDFEIGLDSTWPIAAKTPIPFAPLVAWIFKESAPTVTMLDDKLKEILRQYLPESTLDKTPSYIIPEKDLEELLKGLNRLKKTVISAVIADIEDSDLLTTFTRLNRNGTRVNDDELFYATLKRNWPESQGLLAQTTRAAEAFAELDVLRAFTILASHSKKDNEGKRLLEETSLSPALMKSLRKGGTNNDFDKSIKSYLTNNKAQLLLKKTIDNLRYTSDNDLGLPVVMLPRLEVRTWLPVMHWIEKSPLENNQPWTITPLQREALLRFVLTDHFFADWLPNENRLLRDMLDFVGEVASKNKPFPNAEDLILRLNINNKNQSDKNDVWLKKLGIEDSNKKITPISLPLSPDEMKIRFEYHAGNHKSTPPVNRYIWQGDRSQDLLIWSQRKALNEWFGQYLPDIALLGDAGRPWDYDHIVPQKFFNYIGAEEETAISSALSTIHPNLACNEWGVVKEWRGNLGNYRIWPMGFNRKDGDMPAMEKLTQKDKLDNHVVLSNWWNKLAAIPSKNFPLAEASAIDLSTQKWKDTPPNKKPWTEQELIAFLESVHEREKALYGDLWEVIKPGFATRSGNSRI